MSSGINENSVKFRILSCAVDLFAKKGYTETTIRELADASGMKGSSIYNHFESKNAILECILQDYSTYNTDVFQKRNIMEILRDDPTSDGILKCMQLSFPPERQKYYLKVLCVLLQEQLRNPTVRNYICEHVILRAEVNSKAILHALMKLEIIRYDTDVDFWIKIVSSLLYAFATRSMLGIGDATPDFVGKGMVELLKSTYDLMFETCGVKKAAKLR